MLKTDSPKLDQLHPIIQSAVRAIPESKHYLIALSGGLDSMALLQFAVPYLLQTKNPKIQVVHIHHGLSANADDWAKHCLSVCNDLNLECYVERVSVVSEGQGIEAAARKMRYQVFEAYLSDNGVLLQGHHQNDQAETVLMRLMRGAGPEGLSGIPQQRDLSKGRLFRPWLGLSRGLLEQEVEKFPIAWVEDESNADLQFDRNFVRHEVLPLLETRWPKVLNSLSRTAKRSSQACQYLLEWCEAQKEGVLSKRYDQAIDLASLAKYSTQQQQLFVRYWFDYMQVEHPSEKVFERLWSELIPAEKDAMPALRWGENHLRRFNGCLFYLDAKAVDGRSYEYVLGSSSCVVSVRAKELEFVYLSSQQASEYSVVMREGVLLRTPLAEESLVLRSRRGGESIVLKGSTQNKALKKLLQAKKVEPWKRVQLPLVYYGSHLVMAVFDSVSDSLLSSDALVVKGEAAILVRWLLPE